MFSRTMLSMIKAHDFSFFSGITGWPENVYDRDFSGQYDRRGIRMPLQGSADIQMCSEDFSSSSYVLAFSEEGNLHIKDGTQE